MTTTRVEQFYNTLIKDPDLEIKPGQSRQQAAKIEANYRARQYDNNSKALAMATTPDESSINSLLNHVEQMTKSFNDVVLIKQKPSKSVGPYESQTKFSTALNEIPASVSKARYQNLVGNELKNFATNFKFYIDQLSAGFRDMGDAEEVTKILDEFKKPNPFPFDKNPSKSRLTKLQNNGYIEGTGKNIRLTAKGAEHHLSNRARNNQTSFEVPSSDTNFKLINLNDNDTFSKIRLKPYNEYPPTSEDRKNYVKQISEQFKTSEEDAEQWITQGRADLGGGRLNRPTSKSDYDDLISDLENFYNTVTATQDDKQPLKFSSNLKDLHESFLQNIIDGKSEDNWLDDNRNALKTGGFTIPFESGTDEAEVVTSGEPQSQDSKPADQSDPVQFQTDQEREAEEEATKNQRRQKISDNYQPSGDRIILEQKRRQNQSDYKGHKSSLIEKLADKVESGTMTDDDYAYLHGYSFSGYNNSFQSHLKNQSASLDKDFQTFVTAYSPSYMGDKAIKKPETLQTSLDAQDFVEITNNSGRGPSEANVVSGSISAGRKFEGDSNPSNPDNLPVMHSNYEQSYTDESNKNPGWRFTNGSGSGTFNDEDYTPPPGDESGQQAGDSSGAKSKSTSPEDDLINKAKESGVFDYLYAKTHGADNPFGDKADFEEELKAMGIDKLKKKFRDEHNKMTTEGNKIDDQEQKNKERNKQKQQKADAKTEKQVDSIINSKPFLDKNALDYINAKGQYDDKFYQNPTAQARRATMMYTKLGGDLNQLNKSGKVKPETIKQYAEAATKLKELGADVKKVEAEGREFLEKGSITVAGNEVTDYGSEEHMNLLEAAYVGKTGDEAKNHEGFFNQFGPLAKLREIDPEGKFWGDPKDTDAAPEKPAGEAEAAEDYEGSDIPNEFRGYGTAPEGVPTYQGPQGGSFYDTREEKRSSSVFGGEAYSPQEYGEGLADIASDIGQAGAKGAGKVAGATAAGAKGIAGAAVAGAKKIKDTGAKVGRAFTDPASSPVGAGEAAAGTIGRAGKAAAGAAAKGAKAAKTQVESLGPDAKELAGVARATAGAAAKGAKAVKTRVSDSVGADVARSTAEAAKEGAGKVAQAGKAGAGKVAQAGKAGLGRITGTGKKGAGKVSQAGKTAGERLREFVSDDSSYEYTSPTERRRVPGRSFNQRVSDLFKADDIENPEGLARWLASKYDGVPTTTKPGEQGWERIQSYLTALKDPNAQHNKGKVNRIRNPQTGKRVRGRLKGKAKTKGPKSFSQRAKDARDRGVSMHELADQGFPQARTDHRGSYTQQEMDKDKHSGGRKTIADKHLGHREGVERRQSKKVKRMARQAGEMKKQMPSDELLHKQRQDILERLENLV